MNRWVARLLALAVTAGAVYLVYVNVHAANVLLESTLAAAVLAIATLLVAWRRPTIALILNVVWVAGAFAVPALVYPAHQLPAVVAQSPQPQASLAATTAPAAPAIATSPSSASGATIDAEAKRIGKDPRSLLARVSDGVRLELYPGAFRGSEATLADGAGNDADKALLLRDLIRAADPSANVRFAACSLTPQQADRLIAAVRSEYRVPTVLAQDADKLAVAESDPKTKAVLTKVATAWSGIVSSARDGSERLAAALHGAGATPKSLPAEALRAVASHHVWVQEQTSGSWTDLDPSLPHAVPGASLCAAGSTTPDLPSTEFATIDVRIRLEQRKNGALDDSTAVEGTWPAAQLSAEPLSFTFASSNDSSVTVRPVAVPSGMVAYTPVLLAGGSVAAGQPIVLPQPAGLSPTISSGQAGAAGAAAAAFGTPQPTATPPAAPPAGDLVAAWIQITVNAPNAAPQTVESTIFDRVPYADRAAGRAAGADLAPFEQGDGTYFPLAAMWNVAVTEGTAVAGAGDRADLNLKGASIPLLASTLGRVARSYVTFRRAIFSTAGSPGAMVLSVRPDVTLTGFTWHSNSEKPGSETAMLEMDAVTNHAGSVGGTPGDAVTWGVSSLLGERMASGAPVMLAMGASGLAETDVLGIFDWAPKERVGVKLVRSSQDLDGLSVSDSVKARIASSLQDGSVAYAPTAPVTLSDANRYYGWWLVAPDGSVRDEMQNGRHTEGAEEAKSNLAAARRAKFFARLCKVVRLAAFGGALTFAIADPEAGGHQLAHQARAEQELEEDTEKIRNLANEPIEDDTAAECASL